MNWWPKRRNNNKLNYSDALYIPPSRYGTFIFRDEDSNKLKIINKANRFDLSEELITRYMHSSHPMKPIKTRSYLNYNYEAPMTNKNRSLKSVISDINQTTRFSNPTSTVNLQTNYEPFTPFNSKKIETFNRIMYLPTPKTNNPVSKNNEIEIANQNAYELPPAYKKNPAYSENSTNNSNDEESEYSTSSVITNDLYDESDVNTLNVNEEINLDNEIANTSSDSDYMTDNVVRSYVPFKEPKKQQPFTDFSTEFFFRKKEFKREDYIESENLILKHLSELAKHRAAVFSQKNKNLFRFF